MVREVSPSTTLDNVQDKVIDSIIDIVTQIGVIVDRFVPKAN